MDRTFCVYIMASKSGVLYTGVTSNLAVRVGQHKQGRIPGFTQKYNVTRLVWFEAHTSIRAAISHEKLIKGRTRTRKIDLIESMNPAGKISANLLSLYRIILNAIELHLSARRSHRDPVILSGADRRFFFPSAPAEGRPAQ
jgi:putative endonuclease